MQIAFKEISNSSCGMDVSTRCPHTLWEFANWTWHRFLSQHTGTVRDLKKKKKEDTVVNIVLPAEKIIFLEKIGFRFASGSVRKNCPRVHYRTIQLCTCCWHVCNESAWTSNSVSAQPPLRCPATQKKRDDLSLWLFIWPTKGLNSMWQREQINYFTPVSEKHCTWKAKINRVHQEQ